MEETKEARKSEDRMIFPGVATRLDVAKSKKMSGLEKVVTPFSIWPVLASILDFRELWMISYPYLV